MKKIALLLNLFFILSCKAQQQTIVPLENAESYRANHLPVPDGVYFKDVNNKLQPYLGTWKGNYDDKEITIFITKIADPHTRGIIEDALQIKYVIKQNDIIIEDTRTTTDENLIISGGEFTSQNNYKLTYGGREYQCGQKGQITLVIVPNTNATQMKFLYHPMMEWFIEEKCPNGYAKQVLGNKTTLIKQ